MDINTNIAGFQINKRMMWKVVVGVVALVLLSSIFVIVPAGHRGVVLQFSAVTGRVLDEGIHIIIPFVETVRKIEVRTVKLEAQASAYSRDLQTVDTEVTLNYHVDLKGVNTLYQDVGMDYEWRIIQPAIQESIKEVSAKYTAQELIEQRAKVKEEIKIALTARMVVRQLDLDEFSITNFSFSDAYERAVEEKQVAQQSALKAENDLKRIQVEAEQRVAQAKAEAEAIKIQAQAITQQGGRDYVNLKAIEKWNGILPVTMMGEAIPLVNLP